MARNVRSTCRTGSSPRAGSSASKPASTTQRLDENELLEIERVPIKSLHQAILEGRKHVVSMNYTVLFAAAQGRLPL